MCLLFKKLYFDYSLIIFLNQKINSLNILISTKKIVAIISFRFLYILRDLEIFLDLIEYLRLLIFRYIQKTFLL